MNNKELLTRNLERVGIEQKDNFRKLLEAFLHDESKEINSHNIDNIKKEILLRIFIILNRSNAKKQLKTTSPLTAMYDSPKRKNKLYDLLQFKKTDLKKISQSGFFQSITGMQNGRGMIQEGDFNKLYEYKSAGILSKETIKKLLSH